MSRPLALLSLSLALAASDVEPTKLATADVSPLDPGTIQLSVGLSSSRATAAFDQQGDTSNRGGTLRNREVDFGFDIGAGHDVELNFALGWLRTDDAAADPDFGRGPVDASVGAKWAIHTWENGDDAIGVGILPAVTIPLGRNQDPASQIPTASRTWTAGGVACTSGNFGSLSFNADAGYTHALGSEDEREGFRGAYVADVALGVVVQPWLQPEVNVSWSHDRVDEGPAAWSVIVTAGVECPFDWGRLSGGVARVVDGALVDQETSVQLGLAYYL